jgi:hypothetical protein
MAVQTIPGLSTISSPSSAALMWIADPGASPQDRSFSLANLWIWIARRFASGSGALGTLTDTGDATYVFTGASTVTLPVSAKAGRRLTFKAKTTATSTISANSGQIIGSTSSTSFVLYAQEDYVTLEWDGVSIWYVVATNGPTQIAAQTSGGSTNSAGVWTSIANGLTLGSLNPGVYDLEMDVNLAVVQGKFLGVAIGNALVPISNATGLVGGTANGATAGEHVVVKGYVLTAAATIQGIYISNAVQTIAYTTPNQVGSISARRIG